MKQSTFLDSLMEEKQAAVDIQVTFVDIEKYSNRKSTMQNAVIDRFTEITRAALRKLSQQYIEYAQRNQVNFDTDIIKIPTGDGLAVVFAFQGLHQIHLDFATLLVEEIHASNNENECAKFTDQGWCNCHTNFNVRVGVSEGKGVVYHDLNGNYNVAGTVINVASRIMGLGDRMQILVSDAAYKSLIDWTSDTTLEDSFRPFRDVEVKHGVKLDIYQYCPKADFLNTAEPTELTLRLRLAKATKVFGVPEMGDLPDEARIDLARRMVESLEMLSGLMGQLGQREA